MKVEGERIAAVGEKKNSRLIENVMNLEEVGQGPEADQEGELTNSNKTLIHPPPPPGRKMLIMLLVTVHHQRFPACQRQDLRCLRLREVPPGPHQG